MLMRHSESKIVPTISAAQADYEYAFELERIPSLPTFTGYEGLIKPKSILVETRKMVNYARTW